MPTTPRLKYCIPKINNMSAEQLLRAMLPLPLPYKKSCCHWPPRVCCHTLSTDWLPAPLQTRHHFGFGTSGQNSDFTSGMTLSDMACSKIQSDKKRNAISLQWRVKTVAHPWKKNFKTLFCFHISGVAFINLIQ